MTLEQIAQQAMDYLDSVGVAADYEIKEIGDSVKTKAEYINGMKNITALGVSKDYRLLVTTDKGRFSVDSDNNQLSYGRFFLEIERTHPQKSPA